MDIPAVVSNYLIFALYKGTSLLPSLLAYLLPDKPCKGPNTDGPSKTSFLTP